MIQIHTERNTNLFEKQLGIGCRSHEWKLEKETDS